MWEWLRKKKPKDIFNEEATAALIDLFQPTNYNVAEVARKTRELLQQGANPNAISTRRDIEHPDGKYDVSEPVLIRACRRGHTEAAFALLEGVNGHRADPNLLATVTPPSPRYEAYEGFQRSALMAACKERDYFLIKELLDHGASPTVADSNGNTALSVFMTYSYSEDIIRSTGIDPLALLLKAGAKASAADIEGNTPLHIIMSSSRCTNDAILQLTRAGAKINARNKVGVPACRHFSKGPGDSLGSDTVDAWTDRLDLLESLGADLSTPCSVMLFDDEVFDVSPEEDATPPNPWQRYDHQNVSLHAACAQDLSLLHALLARGYTFTDAAINIIQENFSPLERDKLLIEEMMKRGVDLTRRNETLFSPQTGGQNVEAAVQQVLVEMNARADAQRPGFIAGSSRLETADFLCPALADRLCAELSTNDATDMFSSRRWLNDEERALSVLLLPPQARAMVCEHAWMGERGMDVPAIRALKPHPYHALRKGKLALTDYVDESGHAKPQLIAWWRDMDRLTDPENWKGGINDVMAMVASLPECLRTHPCIDLARPERERETARAGSAMERYMRPLSNHGEVTR